MDQQRANRNSPKPQGAHLLGNKDTWGMDTGVRKCLETHPPQHPRPSHQGCHLPRQPHSSHPCITCMHPHPLSAVWYRLFLLSRPPKPSSCPRTQLRGHFLQEAFPKTRCLSQMPVFQEPEHTYVPCDQFTRPPCPSRPSAEPHTPGPHTPEPSLTPFLQEAHRTARHREQQVLPFSSAPGPSFVLITPSNSLIKSPATAFWLNPRGLFPACPLLVLPCFFGSQDTASLVSSLLSPPSAVGTLQGPSCLQPSSRHRPHFLPVPCYLHSPSTTISKQKTFKSSPPTFILTLPPPPGPDLPLHKSPYIFLNF